MLLQSVNSLVGHLFERLQMPSSRGVYLRGAHEKVVLPCPESFDLNDCGSDCGFSMKPGTLTASAKTANAATPQRICRVPLTFAYCANVRVLRESCQA